MAFSPAEMGWEGVGGVFSVVMGITWLSFLPLIHCQDVKEGVSGRL